MRKRRFRSPHPGIKFKKRKWDSGKTTYAAIWHDPDDDRERSTSMDALGLTNEEQRREWAVQKSRELRRRKEDIEAGSPKRSKTPMGVAIDRFLTDKALEIRARTREIYGECISRFRVWAELAGVQVVEQLTPGDLTRLRSHLLALPRKQAAKGGKRGERRPEAVRRSPVSINRDIRSIKTMLNYWRRLDLTPLLNSDHLKDRLQMVKQERRLKTFLTQDSLVNLIAACLRHDAETFKETRVEHQGHLPVGSTARYYAITPFVLTTLLTGCRLGEVRALRWRQVLLDQNYIALDDPSGIKTGMGRRISLDETPLLSLMFAALKLRAGDHPFVFGGEAELSKEVADNCRARLIRHFGAPQFDWQMLRRTCGTFLTCASGIRGAGSAWLSAVRLGHGIDVAQRHYWGAVNNIPVEAKTLEAAMGIEASFRQYLQGTLGVCFEPEGESCSRAEMA